MRKLLLALVVVPFACVATGQSAKTFKSSTRTSYSAPVHHNGYVKKSGTYVQPHYQTAPDNTKTNNWSSKPNVNPYTGKKGTKDPFAQGH